MFQISTARLFFNSSASLSSIDLSRNQLTSSTLRFLLRNLSTSFVALHMSENKLNGPIPDALGRLTSLQFLSLHDNMLEGGIPISFGNFSHLQTLFISDNNLGVPFEELLGNLSSAQLMFVDLSNSQLTGTIPAASLGRLSMLEFLYLSSNSLQGTISEAHFVTLHNLMGLDLSSNSLTLDLSPDWIPPSRLAVLLLSGCNVGPSFPTWLQTLRDYTRLDLSNTSISDEVPKWFWNLTTYISYLNLSHNQMSGTIPDLSSNLIYRIDISDNKFSGPLPLLYPSTPVVQLSQNRFSGSNISPFICTFTNRDFMFLDLSDNQLEGTLPDCWKKITGLVVLNLNNNNLSGGIPHSLGSLSKLKTLHLRGNNLSGELPPSLKNCRLLQLIDIGGNQLAGTITPWLGELYANMKYLSLRRNRFYGGIPLEICKLAMIQMLDLSENNISGKIPLCFNNFTSLSSTNRTTITTIRNPFDRNDYVDYALVNWKHRESSYKSTLGLLKLIDLSSNKLVGSIPKAFSNMRGLVSLNLSRNSLTGDMDSNIGDMEMLECLDLSRNQLTGEIPVGLARLHFLAVLDLANNNLSGKIPTSTQLQSFNESAFAGNSELCGKPLKLCPEDDNTTVGEDMKEENDGLFGLSFMQEVGISLAFGFIIGFWGAVGSLLMKKSWRSAFFNFFDDIGDWLCVRF